MALDLPQRGVDDGVWDQKLNTALTQLDNRVVDLENAEPEDVTSDNITDASTVGKAVLTAGGQEEAREAIGAGTSNLEIGTSSTTAMAGDTNLSDLGGVPDTRTVNGKALSSNISLDKSDVGLGNVNNTADSAKVVASAAKLTTARTINGVAFDGTANITVADSTKVPTTRTVNGHALSGNIELDAEDVGVQDHLDANNYHPIIYLQEGEAVPSGLPDGTLIVTIPAGSVDTFTMLDADFSTSAGTSFSSASVNPVADTHIYLFVTSGHDTAPELPASVSGLGLTWTRLASDSQSNSKLAAAVYRGLGTISGPDTVDITFSNSMDKCLWQVVQVAGMSSSIVQSVQTQTSSTSPSLSLSSPVASDCVLVFASQNSTSQTLTPTGGLNDLNESRVESGSAPSAMNDGWYSLNATTPLTFAASLTSIKMIFGIQLRPE